MRQAAIRRAIINGTNDAKPGAPETRTATQLGADAVALAKRLGVIK